MYYYKLYDLKVKSDLKFPQLIECEDEAKWDLEVVSGVMPENIVSRAEEKKYVFELGNIAKRKKQVQSITYYSINPIINNCLRHALKNLDKYKQRAHAILKFGIDYNRKKATNIDFSNYYICNELGALKNFKDEDFYELSIYADVETSDTEIKALISQLPRFNKY